MADLTTGELDAVAVGDLPLAPDIYDDTLIPVEQNGEAKHMTGAQWKAYGVAAAKEEADRAAEASTHQPIIQDGTWWLWDVEQGLYVDSGFAAQGEADMSNYLPLTGGEITGVVKVSNRLDLGDTGVIGQIQPDRWNVFLGLVNGELLLAHGLYPTRLRGSLPRPTYNGNDMALVADIPDSDIFVATYNATTYDELLEAYNAGKMLFVTVANKHHPLLRAVTTSDGLYFEFSCAYLEDVDGDIMLPALVLYRCTSNGWSYIGKTIALSEQLPTTENWTFTLEDGSTVTKAVCVE